MHGFLNLFKPAGVTSRDVVNHIQNLVHPAKCGHAGTLDPLATGVLVACIGHATRLTEFVHRYPKSYRATFLLGRQSDTDDIEGHVREEPVAHPPSQAIIEAALLRFIGTVPQRPPDYSAVKIGGRRAYDLARQGVAVEISERPVTIHALSLTRFSWPELELEVQCSSGTYIRSLGRDLAAAVGTCAVMSQLLRTVIGPFSVHDAVDPLSLTRATVGDALLPLARGLESLPNVLLQDQEIERISRGQSIVRPHHGIAGEAAAWNTQGDLRAIVVPHGTDQLRPNKVFGDRG